MFDLSMLMLEQSIDLVPYILGIILCFDFIGTLLFRR